VSSSPLAYERNRLRGGSFWIVCVNAGGKPRGFVPQSRREHERDQFDTVGGLAPLLRGQSMRLLAGPNGPFLTSNAERCQTDRQPFSRERVTAFSLSCNAPIEKSTEPPTTSDVNQSFAILSCSFDRSLSFRDAPGWNVPVPSTLFSDESSGRRMCLLGPTLR
jgi:hypothetical protein